LVDLVAVATDAALRLKHGGEKQVADRFLLNALARAHLG